MRRTALLAAALLSLTLAACSPDAQQRPTAGAAADAPDPSPGTPLPSPDLRTDVDVAPSAVAEAPAAATTAGTTAGTTAAPTSRPAAAPRAAAAPRPARRTTTAPAPRRTPTPAPAASPTRAPAPSSQFALTIRDFAFSPRLLTVPVGSTVTATNQDDATHDWTSDRGVWRSGDLPQGASYSFTFPTSGAFDYLCERHPQMTGTITVTPR